MYLEGSDDPDTSGKMTEFMGPGQVDRTIRQAIQSPHSGFGSRLGS
jgi:hypothetical protein